MGFPILILAAVLLGISSCGNDNTHKNFTMQEGQARYSFEYNSPFKIAEYYVSNNYRHAAVTLTGPTQKEIRDYPSIQVIIFFEPDEYSPDAETTLETWLTKASWSSGFELWEKSEITIDNITAISPQNRPFIRKPTFYPLTGVVKSLRGRYGGESISTITG